MRLEIFPWTTSPRPHFVTFLFAVRLPSIMKVLSYAVIVLATLVLFTCSSSSSTGQVLKFGDTAQDYVMFDVLYEMVVMDNMFSLCSWVKKLKRDGPRYWFHYATASSSSEIRITDHGFSRMFNDHYLNKVYELGITPGTWYHYCMCWSYSSRTADVYYNGVKIGSITTPSRRLLDTGGDWFDTLEGGTIVLGQHQSSHGRIDTGNNQNTFGGELFKLNMFSKKFTAAEVRAMYQAGICSEAEKIHEFSRRLTWESILRQTRHGNVQLVDYSCPLLEVEHKLAVTQRELDGRLDDIEADFGRSLFELAWVHLPGIRSDLETNQFELHEIKTDLNETQTGLETTQSELVTTKAVLEQRLNKTQSELETTQSRLETTQSELETTQSELQEIKSDLTDTQSGLETTQSNLVTINAELRQKLNRRQKKALQSDLQEIKSDLNETQTGLESTKSDLVTTKAKLEQRLNKTQSELETAQSKLEKTQSDLVGTKTVLEQRLNKTQSELEASQSGLETTQFELEATQSELAKLKADLNKKLNLSQSELATKVELELTKTLLTEFRTELNSIKVNLGQRLEQIQNETEESRTKFQDTLAELEETKSKLDETENELKETKTQLALYSRNSTRSVLPVLKFGTAVEDCIIFSPNMEPFTDQFSLCSWVRKLKTDGQPYWISYATEESNSEIGINVQGLSNIFNDIDKLDWRRHLDITPGTWFHYCMCWSYFSRTADVYYNGVKAGSITTPSERRLDTGGSLVLGQYQSEDGEILTKHGNRYTFGGELLKLNMFSKKFSDEEVRAMYQAGVCSDIEDTYESYRLLTWESIIEQPRRGNVELVDPVISCTSAGEETVSEMTGEEITTHN